MDQLLQSLSICQRQNASAYTMSCITTRALHLPIFIANNVSKELYFSSLQKLRFGSAFNRTGYRILCVCAGQCLPYLHLVRAERRTACKCGLNYVYLHVTTCSFRFQYISKYSLHERRLVGLPLNHFVKCHKI